MKRSWIVLVVAVAVMAVAGQARAAGDCCCRPQYVWQGGYYDAAWGMPVALVVPPCARKQANLSWGAGSSRQTHIRAKFKHGLPGPGVYDRDAFLPTPPWPSDTTQFGVYYVRGPRSN